MATLREIKILINQAYLKARRRQAKVFKQLWEDIHKTLTGQPLNKPTDKELSRTKRKEKTSTNTNTSQADLSSENISETIKKAIREEEESNKPVSGAGEVYCKHCRQWVYPEEYNKADGICLLCEKEANEGRG